jgi:hypothetical protein
MIRSWFLLSAIFATLGFALAGCAATPFSPYYDAWRVWPGASCLDPRAVY